MTSPLVELSALPADFHDEHIVKRRPAVLRDGARDLSWAKPNWLEIEPLASMVRADPRWDTRSEPCVRDAGTRSPEAHVAPYMTHAWSAQIQGQRRVLLSPPEGEASSTVLHTGDVVFIPAGWSLSDEALTTSTSVSGHFVNDSNWSDFARALFEEELPRILRDASMRRP